MDEQEILIMNHVTQDVIEAEEEMESSIRQIFNKIDPFITMTEIQFISLFRLNKQLTRNLINLVTPYMEEGQTQSSLDMQTKVLIALIFYAHGSYQKVTGRNIFCGVSQASVSRSLHEVTRALNHDNIFNEWINFPNNINELQDLRTRFFAKYNLPGVIGCIDCTHVAIVGPSEHENIFVNRKGYHSLNVQLISDENLQILNVVSRFPGSAHDAHIWRQSNMSQLMEAIYRENQESLFFLVGDSAIIIPPLHSALKSKWCNE